MGIIELIKKGLSIANGNKNLLLLLFGFGFFFNLVNIPFNIQGQTPSVGGSVSVLILSVVFILASIFMQSGTLGYVRDVIKDGQSDISKFKQYAIAYYVRVLAISIIVGLFILILSIITALVFLIGGETPNAFSVIVALIVAAAGIYGVLLAFLAPYIAVAEDSRVIDSLKKSISIVKANFVKVLSIGLVLVAIGFLIGFTLGILLGLLSGILKGVAAQVIFGFVNSLVNAYLGIVVTATFMAYYLSIQSLYLQDTSSSTPTAS